MTVTFLLQYGEARKYVFVDVVKARVWQHALYTKTDIWFLHCNKAIVSPDIENVCTIVCSKGCPLLEYIQLKNYRWEIFLYQFSSLFSVKNGTNFQT